MKFLMRILKKKKLTLKKQKKTLKKKAEADRDEQYEAMKLRIQYMYENGGNDTWAQILLESRKYCVYAGESRKYREDVCLREMNYRK